MMKTIILFFLAGIYGCAEYSPPDNFSCSGANFPAKWDEGTQIYRIIAGDMTLSQHAQDESKQDIVFKLFQDGFDYHLTVKDIADSQTQQISNHEETLIKLVKLPEDVKDHDFTYHTYAMSFTQGAITREGYCLGYKS
jgi:hypothetical protein